MVNIIKKNSIATAFLLLALSSIIAVDVSAKNTITHDTQTLYKRELVVCNEDNKLRKESNKRIEINEKQHNIIVELTKEARDTRIISFKISHNKNDLTASKKFNILATKLQREIHFSNLPLINCSQIKKP